MKPGTAAELVRMFGKVTTKAHPVIEAAKAKRERKAARRRQLAQPKGDSP